MAQRGSRSVDSPSGGQSGPSALSPAEKAFHNAADHAARVISSRVSARRSNALNAGIGEVIARTGSADFTDGDRARIARRVGVAARAELVEGIDRLHSEGRAELALERATVVRAAFDNRTSQGMRCGPVSGVPRATYVQDARHPLALSSAGSVHRDLQETPQKTLKDVARYEAGKVLLSVSGGCDAVLRGSRLDAERAPAVGGRLPGRRKRKRRGGKTRRGTRAGRSAGKR